MRAEINKIGEVTKIIKSIPKTQKNWFLEEAK
jgi:hypothetical protein